MTSNSRKCKNVSYTFQEHEHTMTLVISKQYLIFFLKTLNQFKQEPYTQCTTIKNTKTSAELLPPSK